MGQVELANVLDKVKALVSARRLLLRPYFSDFDTQHNLKITANQFCSVLTNAGFTLSKKEMDILTTGYAAEGRLCKGLVAYKDFCNDVEGGSGAASVMATASVGA
jgi:Ca2+-binding EF-hand superfamily protein